MERNDKFIAKSRAETEEVESIRRILQNIRSGDFMNLGRENVIGKQWETSRGNYDSSGVRDTENTHSLGYLIVFYF